MFFHFKHKFPQLNAYWDRYQPYLKRQDVPAKTLLLAEGKKSHQYLFIEKGCVRTFLNKDRNDIFTFSHLHICIFAHLHIIVKVSTPAPAPAAALWPW
jgi:hypothetical protein